MAEAVMTEKAGQDEETGTPDGFEAQIPMAVSTQVLSGGQCEEQVCMVEPAASKLANPITYFLPLPLLTKHPSDIF